MLRSLDRLSDQTLAALSAAMVVPRWRIGFLIGPLHIRHEQTTSPNRYVDKSTWCDGHHLPTTLVGRALHLSDIFDKIKTEFVKDD